MGSIEFASMSIAKGPQTDLGPDWLDDRTCALEIGVTPFTIRSWRLRRGLPFLRITGKTVRIRRTDWVNWLAQQRLAITFRG